MYYNCTTLFFSYQGFLYKYAVIASFYIQQSSPVSLKIIFEEAS